ncbi:hypothetical protein IscW_ISCW001870 [Ixodes scapularis]|uniref:Uncharacterized protein n=1 Tax=Ixodes scapularis TaxID=6945 RepID=B7PAG7_IXOSC|nr:hypothetical protein IscW_ISCW001870 [Ixodes scapularis]|eukprot:XP_002406842.1 hypothetical protein IscW_ISCW001870 [Ixodes scapularis]
MTIKPYFHAFDTHVRKDYANLPALASTGLNEKANSISVRISSAAVAEVITKIRN